MDSISPHAKHHHHHQQHNVIRFTDFVSLLYWETYLRVTVKSLLYWKKKQILRTYNPFFPSAYRDQWKLLTKLNNSKVGLNPTPYILYLFHAIDRQTDRQTDIWQYYIYPLELQQTVTWCHPLYEQINWVLVYVTALFQPNRLYSFEWDGRLSCVVMWDPVTMAWQSMSLGCGWRRLPPAVNILNKQLQMADKG